MHNVTIPLANTDDLLDGVLPPAKTINADNVVSIEVLNDQQAKITLKNGDTIEAALPAESLAEQLPVWFMELKLKDDTGQIFIAPQHIQSISGDDGKLCLTLKNEREFHGEGDAKKLHNSWQIAKRREPGPDSSVAQVISAVKIQTIKG